MSEQDAARFNPFHAKAGSPTGGQFSSSSGGSGGAKAPAGHKPASGPAGPSPAALREKSALLAQAHKDEQRARELEKELHVLQKQEHAAQAAAKTAAGHAAAAQKASHAATAAAKKSAAHAAAAAKAHHAATAAHKHHTAAHHKHRKHAATLKQRITSLQTEIHGLRVHAAALEVQAHAIRAAGMVTNPSGTERLHQYWVHGEGAAKIRWGSPGDYDRCVLHLSKFIKDAHGYCAKAHHDALGIWPATHAAEIKHATGRSAMTVPAGGYDADGLDGSWDGDCSDLPDLTGLHVHHFEQAAADMGMAAPDEPAQRAMAKLGTGGRFKKLKASLAAKGAHDPGALAAYIGRRKYGKAAFHKLAAKARGKGGSSRMSSDSNGNGAKRPGEILRFYPLDDIHIVSRADGDGTGRVVEAYAAVFDEAAEIKDHEGHYEETIDRGAFDQVLARIQRSRGGLAGAIRVLYNHGQTMRGQEAPEFQKPLGKPLEVRPDGRGLLTRTEYGRSPLAEEILENIRNGSITAQSFVGGILRSDPQLKGPGDRYRARNGALTRVRRLGLGLREYGPVLYAAYPGAEFLGVRMGTPELANSFDPPVDEEYTPGDDGDVTGGAPEDATSARYHQHALYVMRSRELRESKGLVW
jgi:HK97 family phage prohead protease